MKYYAKLDFENYIVATFVDAGEDFPKIDLSDFSEINFEQFSKVGPNSVLKNGQVTVGEVKKVLPTEEEFITIKHSLINYATQKIAPLQDAIDLDIATDDEKARLLAWKKYRVLVNRVDTSTAPDITWPDEPSE